MPIVSVRIPQLGEGLQEALLVEYLKKPGDAVRRDDPLYTMETDKAVTEVESPYDGKIIEWTADVNSVQAVGAVIATMEVAEGTEEMAAGHGPPAPASATPVAPASKTATPAPVATLAKPAKGRGVPPRTRKYLRQLGLLDQADQIPSKTNKLMPADVDAYLAAQASGGNSSGSVGPELQSNDQFDEALVPNQQQTLNYRLVRGAQVCVPVTIMVEVEWTALDVARAKLKAADPENAPSVFTLLLWCVARAMAEHPKFRSTLTSEGKVLRTYKHANLGIAVGLPSDLLVTAVVADADTLGWDEFSAAVRTQVGLAREGKDQATAATTMSVSNMGSLGIRSGFAAIVSPAVATMTLGETYMSPVANESGDGFEMKKVATITLSFDHRVINGAGAAEFMNTVRSHVEGFELPG